MDTLRRDLRYALRNIVRRPGFSALAVLTLAVGIGITTVAFTGVNALLFHPFVFEGVDRLGWVMLATPGNAHGNLSYREFEELRRDARAFDAVAAEGRQPLALVENGRAEQIWGLFVSRDYFRALGAVPLAGRLIDAEAASRDLSAVVSYRFWRSRLHGDSIAGRTIVLANRTVAVVGVMPDDFQGPGGLFAPDVWLPLERAGELGLPSRLLASDDRWVTAIARLADRSSAARASAELSAIAAHLPSSATPAATTDRRLAFFPMRDGHPEVRGLAPYAWIALAVVGIVLVIACFNVTSLLLARAVERRREISIRAALGAGRWRIVRQLVTEGVVLAAASGVLALVVAAWSERLLAAFSLPAPIPQRLHMVVDARVIAFTALMVVVAGVLPGLLPALHSTRRNLAGSMRLDGAERPSRARHLFVAAQIAGSTLFLATALLFVRSFANATRAEVGFNPDHMIVTRLEPALYGFEGARTAALARTLVERLAAVPGLTVAVADRAPFAVGYPRTDRVSTPVRSCVAPACKPTVYNAVDANYFAASGMTIRAGRTFDEAELARGDVIVVNDVMAEALWPGRSPIGETVTFESSRTTASVVGVTGNASSTLTLGGTPSPAFYRPIGEGDMANGFTLIVRSQGDDAGAARTIRDAVQAAAPAMPIASLQTMHEVLELPMWPRRTAAGFFSVCGILALVLATVGLFGVTYFAVHQRTREFGIRMAIGARPRQLVAQVLREGARFAVPGALAGLLLAAIAARLLSGMLLGVSPTDPTSFLAAGLLEIAVAVVACALPARDAARVDPLIALRND